MKKIKFSSMVLKVKSDERVAFLNCESSNLDSIAYNFDMKELVVVFKSSLEFRYHYEEVDKKVFANIAAANSVGSYFGRNVVNKYEVRKEKNR